MRRLPWRRLALGSVAFALLLGFCVFVYKVFTGGQALPKVVVSDVVQLRIVQPPPPPPPPPPPKMVEQPKITEPQFKNDKPMENKPPSPKPSAEPPPPGPLALDAKAEGPPDSFALGGKQGGADFLGSGGGGGGGGSKYGWYAAMIQGRARETLQKHRRLQGSRYQVAVKVWLKPDGEPENVELVESTGNPETDRWVVESLLKMARLSEPPPADMPEPIVLWVSSI